ncbi:hypothetical protein PENNAL_c0011G02468 [Penicillium nalgiovense]|uniref:Uncharacterized protein n=1 Tax=Penicillium nalgiovense TaxID=60175 RepID=A0A1V6YT57_PENNA|nr:hypothetical protein PENNAL_c0011G02468 [Penicillium nalgiovense]
MNWIGNVSGQVGPDDRIIIVLIGHGDEEDHAVTLYPQRAEREFLSNAETIAALPILPPNATIAPGSGAQRDVLVETAATVGEKRGACGY